MTWIAIRMLTADRAKFFGLIFGVAFSAFLIAQQLTLYVNLLDRASSQINDTPAADVWVMDRATRTPELTVSMPSTDLHRIRGVAGVAWAVPLMIANSTIRSPSGKVEGVTVVGVDDETFIGLPQALLAGRLEDLSQPDSIFVDEGGARRLTPSVADLLGAELELNEQRAVLRGIVDANPTFTSGVLIYTRYSNALNYVPGTRNRMSFVLVRAEDPLVLFLQRLFAEEHFDG